MWWEIAFPFDTKVMATGSKTTQSNAVFAVKNFKQVRGRLVQGQIATDVLYVVGKFVCLACSMATAVTASVAASASGGGCFRWCWLEGLAVRCSCSTFHHSTFV
jgi:hypothetical protein